MRPAVLAIGILFATATVGFAQSEKPECPTINIYGPAGITRPGDPAKFSLELKGSVPENVQYEWTVTNGRITEGQSANAITIVYDRIGVPVTAAVKVWGLAEGCPVEFSETLGICACPVAILVTEGSSSVEKIDKARLNKLVAELTDSPGYQGYLIEYFPPKTTRETINAKTRQIVQHLKKSVDLSRITIVIDNDSSAKPLTRYYIVPPGAMNPMP